MTPPSPSPEAPPVSDPSSDPSQSLSPSEDPTPTSPLFRPTRSPEQPDPETDPESSPNLGGFETAADDSPATPSAPRSTGRARLRALKATVATAVQTVGGVAHTLLTREGTPEREVQLWIPDEEDVESISDPLASLASRRMPEGAENPDVTDLVRLALGVVRYVFKQRDKAAQVQRDYHWEPPPAEGDGDQPREPVDL